MQNFSITRGSREYVWLMFIIQHVRQTCGLSSRKIESTTIYEDNSALFNRKSDMRSKRFNHMKI